MGLALQIFGVLCAIASLVCGILAILGKMPAYPCVVLLFAAMGLIKYGRKIHK